MPPFALVAIDLRLDQGQETLKQMAPNKVEPLTRAARWTSA
jgi:hypothetical protein